MKRKTLLCVLLAEAAVCMLCALLWGNRMPEIAALTAVPFAQIGAGLRRLSLSGPAGNGVSIVLYILLCTPPAVLFLIRLVQEKLKKGDVLLPVISGALFAAMYYFINPSLLPLPIPSMGQVMLGGCIYSLLLTYGAIRLTDRVKMAVTDSLYRLMDALLIVLCIILTWMASFGTVIQTGAEIRMLQEGNTDTSAMGISYGIVVLRGAVHALPYVLDLYVVFPLRDMLRSLARQQSGRAVFWAGVTGTRCGQALIGTMVVSALFNVLQMLLSGTARQIHMSVNFPIGSMLLYVGALLLGRLVLEMKRIRDENESFI